MSGLRKPYRAIRNKTSGEDPRKFHLIRDPYHGGDKRPRAKCGNTIDLNQPVEELEYFSFSSELLCRSCVNKLIWRDRCLSILRHG